MALDRVVLSFKRVHVVTEGEVGRDIGGVTPEILSDLDCVATRCGPIPTGLEALRDVPQAREEGAQALRSEGVHHKPALLALFFPFSGKDSVDPEFSGHGFDRAQATIGLRATAQDLVDEIGIGHDHNRLVPDPKLIDRTVELTPLLEDPMQTVQLELEQVAEYGQPLGPGEMFDSRAM